MKDVLILAIESSCDETSMSIVKNGKDVLSIVVNTQISTHEKFGGVVPEIASRMHTENITLVLDETLKKANVSIDDISAIAVTYGPGLMGSLLVGVEAAKTISYVYKKPLIAVNHMAGHIYANNIENTMEFPILALVVSGGHTDLVYMEDDYKFEVLGSTLDDAIGETYDKVARVLDLKYPGGPNVEKLAAQGHPTYKLPIHMNDNSLNMSFSGLKSAVINYLHNQEQAGREVHRSDVAASFQKAVVDALVKQAVLAMQATGYKKIVLAGGVSANKTLQNTLAAAMEGIGAQLVHPTPILCTDNAVMIACRGHFMYQAGMQSPLDLNAVPSLKLG